MMGTTNAAGAMKITTAWTDRTSANATMTATIVAAKPTTDEVANRFIEFSAGLNSPDERATKSELSSAEVGCCARPGR